MAGNHSKTTKEVWDKVRIDYEKGDWKVLRELAERYGIHPKTLRTRICKFGWHHQRAESQRALLNKVEEVKENVIENYLKREFKRVIRYEKIIDVSQEQLATHQTDDGERIPIMDCEAINDYTIAESRIHELAKSALRIPEVQRAIDVTTKGQSLGESFISAIEKLRQNPSKTPDLTDEELQRVIEAEIVDESEPKTSV